MKVLQPPTSQEDNFALTPSLRASNRDGMAWACMVGLGESFISAFGIFLKASSLQLSLLSTLPQFFGAIFQMIGVWAQRFFRSRKHAISCAVVVNAAVWLPIAGLAALAPSNVSSVWMLLALLLVYYASTNFYNPFWSSLMGDLVPPEVRGRYFGRRNKLVGLSTFLAVFVGGQLLDFGKYLGEVRYGFVVIFVGAFAARVASYIFLQSYDDPPHEVRHEHHFSFLQFLLRSPRSNFARFVFFVSIINGAVNISAPFFTLYMLRDLQFSYMHFTVITAMNTATQFLTMQIWGRVSDQFGNKKILNLCGYGIALSPVFWIFSSNTIYLLCAQMYAGFVWAGFNLAAANFIYDAVTPPKRARCAAYQAMVNGTFVLLGSALGGFLVDRLPEQISVFGWSWAPSSPLFFIFVLSGVVRLLTSVILLPLFKEVRQVDGIRHAELIFRITNLRPMAGATFSILTSSWRRKKR
ncbi:MAG: MFS transporter [Oligoflexia bacterium]|nr:MFS transporter [Oligoflexia bacterium]